MADGSGKVRKLHPGQQGFPFGQPASNSRLRPGEIVVDLFAGGGGGSEALKQATGRDPDIAINHNPLALAMHATNHPFTRHMAEDVFHSHPRRVTAGRSVGWLHASPDCTHFSQAKGGQPRNGAIRSLSWVVLWWAGTARPRIISLENVKQILQWCPLVAKRCKATGRVLKLDGTVAGPGERVPLQQQHLVPDPRRKGKTWARFVGLLRGMGYAVEWRELRACDYGAGTSRTRLFLIARCDGETICWPVPTHGPGRAKPFVTAADCIDWSIPGRSIFDRPKPLADATMRRIARGVKRYVLDAKEPFIVHATHGAREHTSSAPAPTITAAHRGELMAVDATVTPFLTEHANASGNGVFSAAAPLGTACAAVKGGHFAAVAPVLVQAGHGEGTPDNPRRSYGVNDIQGPVGTITASGGGQSVAAATLVQVGYGERAGQAPRALDLQQPLGVAPAGGIKQAAVECDLQAASIVKWRGDSDGVPVDGPLPVITSGAGAARPAGGAHAMAAMTCNLAAAFMDQAYGGGPNGNPAPPKSCADPLSSTTAAGTQQRVVTASMVTFRGTNTGSAAADPVRTLSAGGEHHGVVECHLSPEHEAGALKVAAFLMRYHGTGGQHAELSEPMTTMTVKARLALVTVYLHGHPYVIVDIRLRMLTPRELFNAQGFPASYVIDRTADGRKLTISQQVALVGNSVSPPPFRALVDASLPPADVASMGKAA